MERKKDLCYDLQLCILHQCKRSLDVKSLSNLRLVCKSFSEHLNFDDMVASMWRKSVQDGIACIHENLNYDCKNVKFPIFDFSVVLWVKWSPSFREINLSPFIGPLKEGITGLMLLNKLVEKLHGVCSYKKDEEIRVTICFRRSDWGLSSDESFTINVAFHPF
jgi:hypothetical protein